MKAFINGSGIISAQHMMHGDFLSSPAHTSTSSFSAIEPTYEQLINPAQLRRMSRILKMGNAAAAIALKQAGIPKPDGVITGTGYGCLEDTITFLAKITTLNETALNPTPFMQSTHNTIGSQIALLLQSQGYNQTFVHDAFAFEHSLLDALMLLDEIPDQQLLVGAVDEITPQSHAIKSRFGLFNRHISNSLDLLKSEKRGTIEGEGAAYFVLSAERNQNSLALLRGVRTYYGTHRDEFLISLNSLLQETDIAIKDIDLLLVGLNGDPKNDEIADQFLVRSFEKPAGVFKHLSGEHCVASSFAVWLSMNILQNKTVPEIIRYKGNADQFKNILIYNPYFSSHHSLILLSACQDI